MIQLQLKKEFIEQIKDGTKKYEFRPITERYEDLFVNYDKKTLKFESFKKIEQIRFVNGYNKNRKEIIVNINEVFCDNIRIFEPDVESDLIVFCIEIKSIDSSNF